MTRFHTIAADPPWNERGGGKSKRGADRHYPLMTTPRIFDTVIGSPLWRPAESCHLWLWATTNHLMHALHLMDALGFRYVTNFVWIKMNDGKLQRGLGQYLRHAHELCLLGTRGAAMVPPPERRPPSVIIAPRTKHSAKPDEAFALFERVSQSPRAELFARTERPGWATWGNEVP